MVAVDLCCIWDTSPTEREKGVLLMFCNQCEQTAKGTGCTVAGVCGKSADVAAIQDQLVYLLRRLAGLQKLADS